MGSSVVTVEPGSLAGILDALERTSPQFAPVRRRCSYLVDEVAVHGEDVYLAAGSRVDVLPPFAGG